MKPRLLAPVLLAILLALFAPQASAQLAVCDLSGT